VLTLCIGEDYFDIRFELSAHPVDPTAFFIDLFFKNRILGEASFKKKLKCYKKQFSDWKASQIGKDTAGGISLWWNII
jgi:hypothetical protein